jgi:phosphatidylglycerol---prolipoprotein diacylglyceryl transferase
MGALDPQVRWLFAAPVYAAGYAVAVYVFWRMAQRRGMKPDETAPVMAAGLIGGLIGANLLQLVATGLPGKTIEGGMLGGWCAVVVMKRCLGIVRPTGDLFALAIPAGEAIGRVACFIGGCCYGKAASVAWAVHDHGGLRHPAQLYSAAAAAICFILLVAVERRRTLPENGLFYLGGILFCIDRFVVEFFREVPATPVGLSAAQVLCIAGMLFFVFKLSTLLHAPIARSSRPAQFAG